MASRTKRAKQAQKKPILPFVVILFVAFILVIGGVGVSSAFALVDKWLVDVPSVSNFEVFNVARKTRVYANDHTTLLSEFFMEDREPVEANQVSPVLFDATIAIEDERFWQHNGVDLYGIARAAVNDLIGGPTQGASTITQQFVRQTVLKDEANDMTYERKVREAYLAMEIEKVYSKEAVLMMYLNTINYGDGAYGIQSASHHYFSKDAKDLNLVEAALLAGIPQQPTYNNPVTYPDNALARRNQVLERMYVNNYITKQECDNAKAQPLNLAVNEKPNDGIYRYPYFTSYVRNTLEKEYGTSMIFSAGLDVYTTLDPRIQDLAEYWAADQEASLDPDIEVGISCVDPNTGYILAIRGGKDYYTDQWSSGTDMSRQLGSAFKPFGVVAAIEQGFSPQTPVSGSSPYQWDDWKVSNAGGSSYGTMSLERALNLSLNTAMARLVRVIGIDKVSEVAHRMGIASEIAPYPSSILGASGVNTMEVASAYGTFATGGIHNTPTCITKIVNRDGGIIYEHTPSNDRALTSEVAYAANKVMMSNVTNGYAINANIPGRQVGGKTGTTEWARDSWFVGYVAQYAASVWIGARQEREFDDMTSYSVNAPLWKKFMLDVLGDTPALEFPTASDPEYNPKATFLTQEERAAAAAAAERAAEEAKRAAEEARRAAEAEAAKPPASSTPNSGAGSSATQGSGSSG